MTAPILTVSAVTHRYRPHGPPALSDVGISLERGAALGIVGESGSGKTTLGRILVGAIAPSAGRACVLGTEWPRVSRTDSRRRGVQMIFQDPYGSLNPYLTARQAVAEAARLVAGSRRAAEARAVELLAEVGLSGETISRRPGALSGGQRQRVGIARALAVGPIALVADEPTSSLDVSVQAQIVNLIADLRARHDLTLVLISHDLSVVRQLTDTVIVMHNGVIVEQGRTELTLSTPTKPYTQELVAADLPW
jgi:ABC-type glutathione transport system ATPase component